MNDAPATPTAHRRNLALAVGALGVVYGDIGTSPLYAVRECFVGVSGFPVDEANILGILSLVTWSLVLVVSLQFVLLVLRADNQGEGGLLALAHLVVPSDIEKWSNRHWGLAAVGVFGAALLFGDGIITPALSVLSAVEGLRVVAPELEPFIVPVTVGILLGLFAIQRFGTGRVGQLFGPVMLLWFTVLGLLGLRQIVLAPQVLAALSPHHAVVFFADHGLHGTLILGAVFLTVTGAEALYADLGHFGRAPIQRSWFVLVLPGLLFNYLGQGALLLQNPEQVEDVFYHLAPPGLLVPLVGLATIATIIASQAVISGVFSLTAQAVQLDWFPRARIRHTSSEHRGQLYVPVANTLLLLGTLGLVLAFRSSGGLADAYGIAVSLTMVLTTLLFGVVMREVWRWPLILCIGLTVLFLVIDLIFFLSIARKVLSGGWIPLAIATVLLVVMGVWRRGRQLVERHRPEVDLSSLPPGEEPVVVLVRDWEQVRIPADLGRRAVVLHLNRCQRPFMVDEPHGTLVEGGQVPRVFACFGFMDRPDLPSLLEELVANGQIDLDLGAARYVVIQERLDIRHDRGMPVPLKRLFHRLGRRAARVTDLAAIPPDRVLSIRPTVAS